MLRALETFFNEIKYDFKMRSFAILLLIYIKRLTPDHCASDPAERQRILEAGGEVAQDEFGSYRVNR